MNKVAFCRITAVVLVSCITMLWFVPAHAAYVFVEGGGGEYNVHTKTFLDNRYYHVLRQHFDFSCGSAALASLLTYHYQRPYNENVIIKEMYSHGDKKRIEHEGFSLLDMKNYLTSIGLHSNGYRESLSKLAKVGIPAIVLINRKGYMHFVVVQGVTRDKVLIGDPALGKTIVDRKKFEAMWDNHILFVVEDDMAKARPTFNTNWAWHVKKPVNFSMPMPDTDLASMMMFATFIPNTYTTRY